LFLLVFPNIPFIPVLSRWGRSAEEGDGNPSIPMLGEVGRFLKESRGHSPGVPRKWTPETFIRDGRASHRSRGVVAGDSHSGAKAREQPTMVDLIDLAEAIHDA